MQKPSVLRMLATLALTLVSVVSGPALAAGTPAGTVIQNEATLDFTPEDGTPTTIPSPPVQTTVSAVCAVSALPNGTVAAPGQTYNLLPGESTLLKYTVANSGNTQNTVNLSALVDAASQFTPGDLGIYVDANKNGLVDSTETAVTSVTLPADGSVDILIKVNTAQNSRGNGYVNLVAACGSNVNGLPGERDDDNVALVTVGEPPSLNVTKTFAPSTLAPGEETLVTVTATNTGAGASRPVTVTDLLNTPDMQAFTFKSGSASLQGSGSGNVIEYSADGTTWSASETSPVKAIRAKTDSLAPSATLTLTFRLIAPSTEVGTKRNVARLISGDTTLEAPADITVQYKPSIALGPISNPQAKPGGELSADDKQVKPYGVLGQEVCFPHTVQNLGDRNDVITITGAVETGTGNIRFTKVDGTNLGTSFQTPELAPNATYDFNACYVPRTSNISSATPAFQARLKAASSRGAADNYTIDCILNVANNNTNLTKSGDKTLSDGSPEVVAAGEIITYTLKFTNGQSFVQNNVVVTDDLKNITVNGVAKAAALELVSADQGGVLNGTVLTWTFPTVQPGETITMTIKAKVPAGLPDGSLISNVARATSSEIPAPIDTPPVNNPLFDPAHLTMVKTSTPTTPVSIGSTITYTFTVTNTSPSSTGVLRLIRVTDTLPTGLTYVNGSSKLDGAAIVPTVSGRTYTWEIPGLAPGATSQITFDATVGPDAGSQITNVAVATAISNGGTVTTPPSSALNNVNLGIFGNLADVVGYVFLDVNRNGIYDRGIDIPCQYARVVMANGRIALTDAQGRYHFGSVSEGTVALRLDPNSVANQAISVPQDAGRPGSRLVYVRNLTSIDFPLAPEGGDIAVIRDTTLKVTSTLPGQAQHRLTIRKQVFTTEEQGVYRVQLIIGNQPDLNGVSLTDPLPDGATLLDGQNTVTYDILPSGERAITYRFRYAGDPKGAVTDPTASWRY